jgi:hypothetical protein
MAVNFLQKQRKQPAWAFGERRLKELEDANAARA